MTARAAMRRVVITGQGIVAPLGDSPEAFFGALLQARSGIGRLQAGFASGLECRIAAQAQLDVEAAFSKTERNTLDRVTLFALHAARQALAGAKLDPAGVARDRMGVAMGTGMAGAGSLDEGYARLYGEGAKRLKPFTVLMAMNGAAGSQIALEHQLQGPNLTFSTACSSASVAIGEAMRSVRHGYADVMLAGGAEALLTYGTIRAWEALRTLAREDPGDPAASCRPFSADRTGLVLGEGAAVFVLEAREHALRRGAPILAELVGYGSSNDSAHVTQPSVAGQARAMQAALADAALAPEAIGYINAHGTGTLLNDRTETAAIKAVFGPHATRVPVSSTKSMHGHLMGAAGAVELLACIEAIRQRAIPPTAHLRVPDPECDLDCVPNQARHDQAITCAMSNSFAFGGTSAVLIVRRAEAGEATAA